ncbi:MAG: phosphatase PAP2 family protein [Aquirufa sp.]
MKNCVTILLSLLLVFNQSSKAQDSILKKSSPWITPVVLTGLGLAMYNEASKNAQLDFRNNHLSNFQTRTDDFLQYTPSLMYLGANVAEKITGKTDNTLKENLGIFVIGTGTYVVISQILKRGINEARPDGGDYSFPSGHTCTAFFGARLLDKKFRKSKPWLVVSAYTLASATGTLRMANNKHWASDVLVGAGLGIASAEFASWLYPKLKSSFNKHQAFHIEPILTPNLYAARLEFRF